MLLTCKCVWLHKIEKLEQKHNHLYAPLKVLRSSINVSENGSTTDPEPIDVIMCTWNSNKYYFKKCLLSLKREVPVHHFIVVDRYSSDGTIDIVRNVFPEARIFQTVANLANARRAGIAHVDTKYFAFIDDDIEVSEGWFTKLISCLEGGKQLAATQGFARYQTDYMDKVQERELIHQKGLAKEITSRGYTHNTILRTEVVRDFNPPSIVHSWEDFLLTQHIIKKGYRWLKIYQAQVIHHRNSPPTLLGELHNQFLRAKWNGAGERFVHYGSSPSSQKFVARVHMVSSFKALVYSLVTSFVASDPRILLLHIVGELGYLIGFFRFNENIVPYDLHI